MLAQILNLTWGETSPYMVCHVPSVTEILETLPLAFSFEKSRINEIDEIGTCVVYLFDFSC